MALLAGGVAALGGRLLHTAKKPARNSSEVQQQMVRGSWLHKKDISQEHFRGAAAHVSVCVQTETATAIQSRRLAGFWVGNRNRLTSIRYYMDQHMIMHNSMAYLHACQQMACEGYHCC